MRCTREAIRRTLLVATASTTLGFSLGGETAFSQQPGVSKEAAPPRPVEQTPPPQNAAADGAGANEPQTRTLPIDLPYALRLANEANPTIALARERIREANALRQQAAVLWVPNGFVGGNPDAPSFLPTFYHHDGQIQSSSGIVFNTVKSNFALPIGTGLNVATADALFQPFVARENQNAAMARARAVDYEVQLNVALAYLDLLRAYGALAINAEALSKAQEMLGFADAAIRSGLGKTSADANRARTEVEALKRERSNLEGDVGVVSARVAQLLLLDPTVDLIPIDRAVQPIVLVPAEGAQILDELVAVGVMNRPELAESRSLVQAALLEWRENKLRPLFPILQAYFYDASFQGGDPGFHNTGRRDDFIAQASWEVHNGGLGDLFRARQYRSRWNQANLHVVEVQAQVAAEVVGAAKRVIASRRALRSAQASVQQGEELWARLSRAAFGFAEKKYDPLEALIAEQQLYASRLGYLDEVITFDQNQFRLYWALGKPPMNALPESNAIPVQTPVIPPGYQSEEKLRMPVESVAPGQPKP